MPRKAHVKVSSRQDPEKIVCWLTETKAIELLVRKEAQLLSVSYSEDGKRCRINSIQLKHKTKEAITSPSSITERDVLIYAGVEWCTPATLDYVTAKVEQFGFPPVPITTVNPEDL